MIYDLEAYYYTISKHLTLPLDELNIADADMALQEAYNWKRYIIKNFSHPLLNHNIFQFVA